MTTPLTLSRRRRPLAKERSSASTSNLPVRSCQRRVFFGSGAGPPNKAMDSNKSPCEEVRINIRGLSVDGRPLPVPSFGEAVEERSVLALVGLEPVVLELLSLSKRNLPKRIQTEHTVYPGRHVLPFLPPRALVCPLGAVKVHCLAFRVGVVTNGETLCALLAPGGTGELPSPVQLTSPGTIPSNSFILFSSTNFVPCTSTLLRGSGNLETSDSSHISR